jgi:NAD(P)-dependent dehydrogenase (short-subunit alcohol dehydrogenase family)
VSAIGPATAGIQADVSVLADLDRVRDAVAAEGRGLDVLFANAGGSGFARLEQVTEEHYQTTFDIDVKGATLPRLTASRRTCKPPAN